ncbi:MAG: fibronectin type repeat, repeat and LamG-like protein, partial [Chromatiaceae bacterium]|nr:fibronectin type repeat, repeat and LamG-like protein [Chromatiaceae bacterium]
MTFATTTLTLTDSVYVVGGTTARLAQGDAPALPAAPSGLTYLLLTPTSADLSWTDNATDETGFIVERCTGTLLFCGGNPGAWTVRTTMAANVTRFNDTGLAAGTVYNWRMK